MTKAMFVNVMNEEESRIAIVADGLLEELSIETAHDEILEGNIYKARIDKVVPSLDAAFVDYGREKNGFLALSEIRHEYYTNNERKPENLKRGQELMVRVKKGEMGEKGAALTTYISIPGRYLVLMPFMDKRTVSRQIQDDKIRNSLKKIVDDSPIPEGGGYIIRTAAGEQKKQDIQRDVNFMLRLWKRINTQYKAVKAPAPLYKDSDIVIRTIRDYFTPEIKEVLVDNQAVYERVQGFFRAVMPWNTKRVKLYEGHAPLFSKHNLEQQITTIRAEKVKLPSGGSIVIQPTEALVSVDVNSGGGGSSKDIEQTALTTNLEAAREVARQLRLRDLGGLIVIDFIDMRSSSGRSAVKRELSKSLKSDKARTDIGTISKFGLLELSRQRIRGAKPSRVTTPCPHCGGTGTLRSTESVALSVLRTVQGILARNKQLTRISLGVSVEAATYLLNRKRVMIGELERRSRATITIFAEPELSSDHHFIEFFAGEGKARTETNLPTGFPTDRLLLSKGLPIPELEPDEPTASYGDLHDEPTLTDESGDGEASAEQPESASKKRRRRRRRQKSNGGETDSPAEGTPPEAATMQTADESTSTGEQSVEATPDAASDTETVTTSGEASTDKPKRPRRRRGGRGRGRGRKTAEAAAQTEQTEPTAEQGSPVFGLAPEPTPTDSAPKAPGETAPEAAAAPETEPPKRPRRRRPSSAKKPEQATAEGNAAPEPSAQKEFTPEQGSSFFELAPERTSTDPAPETPRETASEPVEAQETDSPKKPRRRRPSCAKKAAKPTTEEQTAAQLAAEPATVKKPRRRPSRAKKASPTTAEGDAAPTPVAGTASDAAGQPAIETAPAPAKKPRRRPSRAKKATPPASEPGKAKADAAAPSTPAAEEKVAPKPRPRRRAPRKKAVDKGSESGSEPSTGSGEGSTSE